MDTRKFAMNYGLYLGIGLSLINFISYYLGLDLSRPLVFFILRNLLIGYSIFYIINLYKENNNGFISYELAVKLGTTLLFYSSVIIALYNYVFINFINLGYVDEFIIYQQNAILSSDPNIDDDQLDFFLNFLRKMLSPIPFALITVIQYSFVGFIYSLIIGSFTKKEDPNLIV